MSKPELALVIVAASLVGVVVLIGLYRFVTVNPDMRNDDINLDGYYGPSWWGIIVDILFWWFWW